MHWFARRNRAVIRFAFALIGQKFKAKSGRAFLDAAWRAGCNSGDSALTCKHTSPLASISLRRTSLHWKLHPPREHCQGLCTSMYYKTVLAALLCAPLLPAAFAQFPSTPENVTTIRSKLHSGVKITYKEVLDVCETTPGVTSYAGYVHLPPNALNEDGESQNYPINTFFWFHEARKNPHSAPLAIWLNGGPGGC